MSWLLFMDESGHDHKNMPGEVRGGVAIHASRIWPFLQAWHALELEVFGVRLTEYRKEIKGHKLLDKDRFKWANQSDDLTDDERRKGVRRFLTLSMEGKRLARQDFTAYGQACVGMAKQIMLLLKRHDAKIFASIIPKGVRPPKDYAYDHFLRKDHVFLFERFYYFLRDQGQHGLVVMDQTEKTADSGFVDRLQSYFLKTQAGRERTEWIVPSPLFVSSDMSVGVQAADLVLYCINWGFRIPVWGFEGPVRAEIADGFRHSLHDLQFHGHGSRNGQRFESYGIFYLPDPYQARPVEGGR